MERRFKPRFVCGFYFACAFAGCLVFLSVAAWAAEDSGKNQAPPVSDNTSASFEMIAERMKSLSGSLAAIPAPPELNQVIQIPGAPAPETIPQNSTHLDNQEEIKK